jgi:acyl dehydratase
VTIFDALEVGAELPTLSRVVTREDVKAYADAGGDHNPLHQDEAFARSVGFDGIIAHGMFTMGLMAAAVVAWAGPGAEVRRITATFRSPVSMGETIVAGGRVRALDRAERTATVETWVTVDRDGNVDFPIKRGQAVVSFP